VSVLLGNGDGSFQAAVNYPVHSGAAAVVLGDLNGDGHLDIATTNPNTADVSILLGNGDGTFQPAASYPVHGAPRGIAMADFNKDGKLDVVTADDWTQDVAVLLGTGDGAVQSPVYYAGGHGGENGVAVGDFTGDGYPDIVAADGGPPGADPATVSVWLNNGDGTFGTVAHFPSSGPTVRHTVSPSPT
jgi:hypothetical protein